MDGSGVPDSCRHPVPTFAQSLLFFAFFASWRDTLLFHSSTICVMPSLSLGCLPRREPLHSSGRPPADIGRGGAGIILSRCLKKSFIGSKDPHALKIQTNHERNTHNRRTKSCSPHNNHWGTAPKGPLFLSPVSEKACTTIHQFLRAPRRFLGRQSCAALVGQTSVCSRLQPALVCGLPLCGADFSLRGASAPLRGARDKRNGGTEVPRGLKPAPHM